MMPKFNMSAHEPTIRSISGRYASISEIAAAERIDRDYVGSILRLNLLAPDIVEAIIDGRQSEGLSLPILLEPFPLEWGRQRVEFVVVDGPPCPHRHRQSLPAMETRTSLTGYASSARSR